jgi:hypothetical protein
MSRLDQADALGVAASRSGRPAHLLEKDIWVVWALQALFDASFGDALVFKGGTSLSKAYQAIARFSEDVDLTYDIRAIAPDLAAPGSEGLPPNQSQEQKWTRTIKARLEGWTADTVSPELRQRLRPARTFWEKATAIHVFCRGGKIRGDDRFSRHWYDVVSLDKAGHAAAAISDRDLAERVARHKSMFFRERDESGDYIDYTAAVAGDLRLVPEGRRLTELANDYARMVDDGLFLDPPPAFESLIEHCHGLRERAVAVNARGSM